MASNDFITRFQGKIGSMNKHGTFDHDNHMAVNKTSSAFQFTGQSIIRSSFESKDKAYAFQSLPDSGYNFFRPIKALGHSSSVMAPSELQTSTSAATKDSSSFPAPQQVEPQIADQKANARLSPKSDTAAMRRMNYPPVPKRKRLSPISVKETSESKAETKSSPSKSPYNPYTLKDYKQIRPSKYYILGGLGPSNVGTEVWTEKKSLYDRRVDFAKKLQRLHAEQLLPTSRKPTAESASPEPSTRQRALEFAKNIKKPPLKMPIEFRTSAPARLSELESLEAKHEEMQDAVSAIRNRVNY
mmetsp:Transcript_14666/g.27183  ORF Transcript_14666/g.27183 Transcript_14666/m.27183 type:complete len:300 (+) Transcript_14666:49-948(+)